MDFMTKEESYADRRQLFKNIWDTAMMIEERGADNIMTKPKVIKTLRLDEVDKCADKRKKERIRNLRTVCRKILDFCDRQDADDFDQNADGENRALHLGLKRIKTRHRRKRVKKKNSLLVLKKFSVFDRRNNFPRIFPKKSSRYNSPSPKKEPTLVERALISHRRAIKVKSSTDAEGNNEPSKGSATRRKVMSKSPNKRKKSTTRNFSPPGPSGILDCPHP